MKNQTATIDDATTEVDWSNDNDFLILSHRSKELPKEVRARAAMACPVKDSVGVIKDESVVIVDCGATDNITGSLIITADVEEMVPIIETADG